jgi:hypothetical protein
MGASKTVQAIRRAKNRASQSVPPWPTPLSSNFQFELIRPLGPSGAIPKSGASSGRSERTRCLSVKTPLLFDFKARTEAEGFGGYFPPCPLAFDRTGGQHGAMQTTQTEVAELVKLHPAKRQARFYRLEIWPDLFGGFSLAREYGRIGSPDACTLIPSPRSTRPAKPLPASSAGSSAGGMFRPSVDSRIKSATRSCRG